MMTKTRFGFVGLDHWYTAVSLIEAIAAHEGAEVAGIADENIDHARSVAEKAGVARITANLHELIDDPTIDVIASFVSADRNPEIVIAAAQAGKHIVSVKPLAMTLDEADRVVEAVEKAGVVFIPGESRARASDLSVLLKSWIDSGRLGTIVSAGVTLSGGLPQAWPDSDDPGWWADPARSPGGAWIDHSLYHLDLLRWLLDDEVADVTGRIANLVHPDIRAEDYGHAIVRFSKGPIATVEDTWAGPRNGWRIATSIVGTRGTVAIDSVTGRLSLLEDGHDGWQDIPAPSDSWLGLDAILAAVAGEKPIATVRDAWENLAVSLAFYEAAKAGTVVAAAHPRRT
jgi:predicted dehydrogenase